MHVHTLYSKACTDKRTQQTAQFMCLQQGRSAGSTFDMEVTTSASSSSAGSVVGATCSVLRFSSAGEASVLVVTAISVEHCTYTICAIYHTTMKFRALAEAAWQYPPERGASTH
jgi:hypothetical protein